MQVPSRALAATVAVLIAVLLAGCSAFTTVDDNQSAVCPRLYGMQQVVAQATGILDPETTVAAAAQGTQAALDGAVTVRPTLSMAQTQLLDRYSEALREYQKALATRPADDTLESQLPGLDAYRLHVLATYRTMLTTVGCGLPGYYATLPRA